MGELAVQSISISDIITFLQVARKGLGPQALQRLIAGLDDADTLDELNGIPEFKTVHHLIADAGRLRPMLVDRLLPANSLFLLTGKPKAGKSFLALDIADSVSRSAPVFGE